MSNSFNFSYRDAYSSFGDICADYFTDFGHYLRSHDEEEGALNLAAQTSSTRFHVFCLSLFSSYISKFYGDFLACNTDAEDLDDGYNPHDYANEVIMQARFFVEHFGVVALDYYDCIRPNPSLYCPTFGLEG